MPGTDEPRPETRPRAPGTAPADPHSTRILRVLVCVLVLGGLAGGYWVKYRLGINLFKSFSLMSLLRVHELRSLSRRLLDYPQPGVLILDPFRPLPALAAFWSQRPFPARLSYLTPPGRGLRIENPGPGQWTYTYKKKVSVSPGERFEYRVRYRASPGSRTEFGVNVFAANGRAVNWRYARTRDTGTGEWTLSGREFVVPEGADSVRFYLSGAGRGEYLFSDISFHKLAQ